MAWLSTKEWQFGRQNVFATDVGAADIPTSNTASGNIQLGDLVINLSGVVGAPAFWVCTASSASSVTFSEGPIVGGANQTRSVAGSTTLLSTDRYLFITAAGAVTLPAPSAALGSHDYNIKATAQPVTITAASGSLDGVSAGSQYLSSYQTATVFTDGTNWFTQTRDYTEKVTTPGATYTLAPGSDRNIIAQAGTLTVPAPASWPLGQTFSIYATASSVTITPASGNINGAASVTLAANHAGTYYTDGTNFFSIVL